MSLSMAGLRRRYGAAPDQDCTSFQDKPALHQVMRAALIALLVAPKPAIQHNAKDCNALLCKAPLHSCGRHGKAWVHINSDQLSIRNLGFGST